MAVEGLDRRLGFIRSGEEFNNDRKVAREM